MKRARMGLRALRVALGVWAMGCRPIAAPPDAGSPGDAGLDERSVATLFTSGQLGARTSPRVARAPMVLAHQGGRRFSLELGVDLAQHTTRRLNVADDDGSGWALEEQADERFNDFAVHPSGEVTLALEHPAGDRDTYELRRLDADGRVLASVMLPTPDVPAADLGPTLAPAPFLMRGPRASSVVKGWLPWQQVKARGEDVVLAFETYAERADGGVGDGALLMGVMALAWTGGTYQQRWARVVDAEHPLIAISWQYDEFLWLDAAMRPLLALTPGGGVVVGRTLGFTRCLANARRFGDTTEVQCRTQVNVGAPHRYQAFAATRFDADGGRGSTTLFAPQGVEELVLFDLALSPTGDALAVVGTVASLNDAGTLDWYFEPPGDVSSTPLTPYDAELAVLELEGGTVRYERRLNLGRAEHLSAVRWTPEGVVAAGGAGWNRWYGGMSLSRGANPLLVFDPLDGGVPLTRELASADRSRHAHLLCVDVERASVRAGGPFDAPMTHSADTDRAQLATGGVVLELQR